MVCSEPFQIETLRNKIESKNKTVIEIGENYYLLNQFRESSI